MLYLANVIVEEIVADYGFCADMRKILDTILICDSKVHHVEMLKRIIKDTKYEYRTTYCNAFRVTIKDLADDTKNIFHVAINENYEFYDYHRVLY